MLMNDEWFGNRSVVDGRPLGDQPEWIAWDFALAKAFQTVSDFTGPDGIEQWVKDDPAAVINAKRVIDPFQEAVDEITHGAKYKPANGERFVPDISSRRSDGSLWTYREWVLNSLGIEGDGKMEGSELPD